METHRDVMINFPLPILAQSFTKSGSINLRPMLLEAMRTHIGHYCIKKKIRPDSTVLIIPGINEEILSTILLAAHFKYSWEEAHNWTIGEEMIEFVIEEATAALRQYMRTSIPPYCSISLSVWLDFMDNEEYKDEFEKVSLLCAMAVRSIVGPNTAKPIKWEFILSRMAGNSCKICVSSLPEKIQMYDQGKHRKLKEKLIRNLQKHWGIQYQFKGRTPWYSTNSDIDLVKWIEDRKESKTGYPTTQKPTKALMRDNNLNASVYYREVEEYFERLIPNTKESIVEYDILISNLVQEFMYEYMAGQKWDNWQKVAIFWLRDKGTPI